MKRPDLLIISILLLGIISMSGCSPYKKSILNTTFHNTTAHYNAEFIASERLAEIEKKILDGQTWDYTRILPIYPQFDTTTSQSLETEIEDCIKKASLIIQYHPNSKWVDNAYTIIGKARFYQSDFQNAVETFKYVNTKGEGDNEKHEALVALMRTFIESNEYSNARAVSDYLKKEKLNKRNLKELYLTRAYFQQKRDNIELSVKNLTLAEPLIDKKAENSRIRYTIGQMFQELGEDSRSFTYYKKCLKGNPPYELTFFTRLNMAQVTTLAKGSDESKIRKYFRKLLRDTKNEEFKDKIYYDYAKFEIRKNNLGEAIEKYKLSIKENKGNELQKSLSYLGLGNLYYDSLQQYELASTYYDSAESTMPKTEEIYPDVKKKKDILAEFVENYVVVEKNDSLIALSYMDTTELYAMIDSIIDTKKLAAEEEAKREKKRAASVGFNAIANKRGDFNAISLESGEGGTWYFYNTIALTSGYNNFQRIWGNRVLEDNWRRSVKEATISNDEDPQEQEDPQAPVADLDGQEKEEQKEENPDYARDTYLSKIPYAEQDKAVLLKDVEVALYNLGKIYNYNLENKPKSIESFKGVATRFDTSQYRPESLYFLYRLYGEQSNDSSEIYKDALLTSYPDDIYSKLVENPNYREENRIETKKLKQEYGLAYRYFKANDYDRAQSIIASAFAKYPENRFLDQLAILDAIIIGKTKELHEYQFELNKFINTYTKSSLLDYAKKLLEATKTYKFNLVNSGKAKYLYASDTSKYFIVLTGTKEGDPLLDKAEQLITSTYVKDSLTLAPVLLDANTSVTLVKTFDNLARATLFYYSFSGPNQPQKETETSKIYYITKENFDILYETKELETYDDFFKEIQKKP